MATRSYNHQGRRILLAGGVQGYDGGSIDWGTGFPKSGTSGTTVKGSRGAPAGGLYVDTSTGVVFVNEGTAASPYWTPESFDQRGLMAWNWDGRDGTGKAVTDTVATATLTGSGLRIHGQGIADTDSGFTVTMSDQGPVGALVTTNETAHTAVLSVGTGTTPVYQPDQNGTMVIDVNGSNNTAITARAIFCGFCGSAADALDPVATGATTTISFAATVGDDVVGILMDSGLTDSDGLFAPHDAGNANASIATTATGVDLSTTMAAAGTDQRYRVEVDADGGVRVFVDKVLVSTFAAATMDVDEELHPVFYIESNAAATKQFDVKHFHTWGVRA